ncbi:MAG: universal stress protein [Pseudomonadota bacterium]|nr:universal stress protein [Pseudomonadota bacterium]
MKILVAVDGSSYSRMAIDFVASRKTLLKSKSDIQVLNVQSPLPANPARVLGNQVVRKYYAEEAEAILKPVRDRFQKAGLNAIVRYVVGRPASEISAAADKDNTDLVILGSQGHSALSGMLLGSVTNEVLVRTKIPMLILRGDAKDFSDSLKVGIAVDGSSHSRAVVKYLLRHLEFFGANPQLTLINVVQDYALTLPSVESIVQPAFSESEVRKFQDESFEGAVKPARALLQKRGVLDANEVRLAGNPGDALSAYAKKKLDLLVLGSHGHGAFKAAVMGSVAARVAARCSVPLLLVRD